MKKVHFEYQENVASGVRGADVGQKFPEAEDKAGELSLMRESNEAVYHIALPAAALDADQLDGSFHR